MSKNINPITNYGSKSSSAFVLDMRESTKIIRRLTKSDKRKLRIYTDFLMDLKQILYDEFSKTSDINMALNDTGDGILCLFWNKTHAWTALTIASGIDKYLSDSLPNLEKKIKLDTDFPNLRHGIGLHSGSSIIYRYKNNRIIRDFSHGIVINTAARIESFTKIFTNVSLLISGYLFTILKKEFGKHFEGNFEKWESKYLEKVVTKKVDIKDAKGTGHFLYTLKKPVLILPKMKSHRI